MQVVASLHVLHTCPTDRMSSVYIHVLCDVQHPLALYIYDTAAIAIMPSAPRPISEADSNKDATVCLSHNMLFIVAFLCVHCCRL